MSILTLRGASVHGENGEAQSNISIANGKISAIDNSQQEQCIELNNSYHIIPGMIDMHIHGSSGADVMDATPDALQTICNGLAKTGTTSFLATTMSESEDKIEKALKNVAAFANDNGAEIIGIHLEGPYLAPGKKGAQDEHYLQAPDHKQFQQWQQLANNMIRLVTVAPELDHALPFIETAANDGVIVSVGHSNASFDVTNQAIDAGASHATHLFNAMGKLQHRNPGTAGALLLSDKVMAELIADNHHLHPALLELTYRVKGCDKCVLVTDATRGQCMPAGEYDLGGQAVFVKDGAVRLADSTLAGSIVTQHQAAINMQKATNCDFAEIIKMTSSNPAKALKIDDRKGSLAVGKDADICVLNKDMQVVLTICRGKIVFNNL